MDQSKVETFSHGRFPSKSKFWITATIGVGSKPSYLPTYSYVTSDSTFSTTAKPSYLQSYLTRRSDISRSLVSATSIQSYATRSFHPSDSLFLASTKSSHFKSYVTRISDLTQSLLQVTSNPTYSQSYLPYTSTTRFFRSNVPKNFDLSESSLPPTPKPKLHGKSEVQDTKSSSPIVIKYGGGGGSSGFSVSPLKYSLWMGAVICVYNILVETVPYPIKCFLWMGSVICVYIIPIEKVPYSKRKHVQFVTRITERKIGICAFENKSKEKNWRVLPSNHQQTLEMSSILNSITQVADKHVDGMDWKLFVVDEPNVVNATSYPGGIVVVFTGLLKKFTSTDELATIIAHEVGHVVARHAVETIVKELWIDFVKIVLLRFIPQKLIKQKRTLIREIKVWIELPRSRKYEKEADFVGLLLMASAGHDPRVAPKVYEKLGEGKSIPEFLSAHPDGSTRSQLLSKPEVMQEALHIYKDASSRHN